MAQREITMARDGARLVWTFGDGIEPLSVDVAALAADVREHAMYHGIGQKVGDAAALGKGSTVAQKRAAMAEVIETLVGGEWNRKRAGAPKLNLGDVTTAVARTLTDGDVDRANLLIDNLARKRNIGRDEAARAFAEDVRVATELVRIRDSRRPMRANANDLIAEAEAYTAEVSDGRE